MFDELQVRIDALLEVQSAQDTRLDDDFNNMSIGLPGSWGAALILNFFTKPYQAQENQDLLREDDHKPQHLISHFHDVMMEGDPERVGFEPRPGAHLHLPPSNLIIPASMAHFTTGHLHPKFLARLRLRQHFLNHRAQAPRFSTGYQNWPSKINPTPLSRL